MHTQDCISGIMLDNWEGWFVGHHVGLSGRIKISHVRFGENILPIPEWWATSTTQQYKNYYFGSRAWIGRIGAVPAHHQSLHGDNVLHAAPFQQRAVEDLHDTLEQVCWTQQNRPTYQSLTPRFRPNHLTRPRSNQVVDVQGRKV